MAGLKAYEGEGKVGLSSQDVIGSEFILEEFFYGGEVLNGLLVIVRVNSGIHWIGHVLQVLLHDELLPNLRNFREETSGLLNRIFFSEELTHIKITAAKINAFGSVLLAFQENALG